MEARDGDRDAHSPEELRSLMDALGLHQAALARIVAVDRGAPTRWLSGAVPVPPWLIAHLEALRMLRAICGAVWATTEARPEAEEADPPARLRGLPVFVDRHTFRQADIAFKEHGYTIGAMSSGEVVHTMKPEEFREALAALGWPQRQFAARVGVTVGTANRWAQGHNEIPAWVPAHLGLLMEIQRLHGAFVAVQRETRGT